MAQEDKDLKVSSTVTNAVLATAYFETADPIKELENSRIKNRAVNEWLHEITVRIIESAQLLHPDVCLSDVKVFLLDTDIYAVVVIDQPKIDSHAVCLSLNLLKMVATEDAISMVIAHEVAHIIYRKQNSLSSTDTCTIEEEVSADKNGQIIHLAAGYSKAGELELFGNLVRSVPNEGNTFFDSLVSPHLSPQQRLRNIRETFEGIDGILEGKVQTDHNKPSREYPQSVKDYLKKLITPPSKLEAFLNARAFEFVTISEKTQIFSQAYEALKMSDSDKIKYADALCALSLAFVEARQSGATEVSDKDGDLILALCGTIVNKILSKSISESEHSAARKAVEAGMHIIAHRSESNGINPWFSFPPVGFLKKLDDAIKEFIAADTPEQRVFAAKNYNSLQSLEAKVTKLYDKYYDLGVNFLIDYSFNDYESLRAQQNEEDKFIEFETNLSSLNKFRINSPFRSIPTDREGIQKHSWVKEAALDSTGEFAIFLYKRVFSRRRSYVLNGRDTKVGSQEDPLAIYIESLPLGIHRILDKKYSSRTGYKERKIQELGIQTLPPTVDQISQSPRHAFQVLLRYLERSNTSGHQTIVGSQNTDSELIRFHWSEIKAISLEETHKLHAKAILTICDDIQDTLTSLSPDSSLHYKLVSSLPEFFYSLQPFYSKLKEQILSSTKKEGIKELEDISDFIKSNIKHLLTNVIQQGNHLRVPRSLSLIDTYVIHSEAPQFIDAVEKMLNLKFSENIESLSTQLLELNLLPKNRFFALTYPKNQVEYNNRYLPFFISALITRAIRQESTNNLTYSLMKMIAIDEYDFKQDARDAVRDFFVSGHAAEQILPDCPSVEIRFQSLLFFEKKRVFESYQQRLAYWQLTLNDIEGLPSSKDRIQYYERIMKSVSVIPVGNLTSIIAKNWSSAVALELGGTDDKTEKYSQSVLLVLSSLKDQVPDHIYTQLCIELGHAVTSQKALSITLRNEIKDNSVDQSLKIIGKKLGIELITLLSKTKKDAHTLIDFLRSPPTDESVSDFYCWIKTNRIVRNFATDLLALNDQEVCNEIYRIHDTFWRQPIIVRALIMQNLVVDPDKDADNPIEAHNDSKLFLLESLFPELHNTSPDIKNIIDLFKTILDEHLSCVHESERNILIGAALASGMALDGNSISRKDLGHSVAEMASSLGTAYIKFVQGIESLPGLDREFASGLHHTKGNLERCARWEMFDRIEQVVPDSILDEITYFGPITNTASSYFVVQTTGKEHTNSGLRIQKKHADALADKGFLDIKHTAQNVFAHHPQYTSYATTVLNYINRARIHSSNELIHEAALKQYEASLTMYPSHIGTYKGQPISLKVIPWYASGHQWQYMEWALGENFDQAPEEVQKIIANIKFYSIVRNILSGKRFDTDRHEEQFKVLIEEDSKGRPCLTIQILDPGGITDYTTSQETIITVLKELDFTEIKSGNINVLLQSIDKLSSRGDKSLEIFLPDLKKAFLALSFTFPHLDWSLQRSLLINDVLRRNVSALTLVKGIMGRYLLPLK